MAGGEENHIILRYGTDFTFQYLHSFPFTSLNISILLSLSISMFLPYNNNSYPNLNDGKSKKF